MNQVGSNSVSAERLARFALDFARVRETAAGALESAPATEAFAWRPETETLEASRADGGTVVVRVDRERGHILIRGEDPQGGAVAYEAQIGRPGLEHL